MRGRGARQKPLGQAGLEEAAERRPRQRRRRRRAFPAGFRPAVCAPPAGSRRRREGRAEPHRERSQPAPGGRRGLRDPAPSAAASAGRRGTGLAAAAPPFRPAGARGGGPGVRPEAAVAGAVIQRAGPGGPVLSRPAPLRPRGPSPEIAARASGSGAAPRPALLRSRPAGLRSLAAPAVQPSLRRRRRGSRAEGRAGAASLRGGSPD